MDYVEGVMNPERIVERAAYALRNWVDLSLGKTTSLHDVYRMLDKDNSGTINVSELMEIFQDFGQTELTIVDLLQQHGDGKITFKEFESLMTDTRNIEKELRNAFKLLDMHNTGLLTAAELRHVFTTFNLHLHDDEIDMLITKADINGDGQVDVEEFLAIFMDSRSPKKVSKKASQIDMEIFENLKRRRGVYGDIIQSVETDEELKTLLLRFDNNVPKLINHLEEKYKHNKVFVPPAYLKDGERFQPKGLHIATVDSGSEEDKDQKHEDEELNIDSPDTDNPETWK